MNDSSLHGKYPNFAEALNRARVSGAQAAELLAIHDKDMSRKQSILSHPEASGRNVLAEVLAYKTDCSLHESIAILKTQQRITIN